ncbi:MAG: outer membrane beta-barrel protein [Bacteroidales bacterium]|nr:outer membrane beta-barrel protein [Bacteroidales bacterium]
MIYRLALLLLLLPLLASGQTSTVTGFIGDEAGKPLPSATTVLLNPVDSTMRYFGVTNTSGVFELKNVARGRYLLQVGFLGYQTVYREVTTPLPGDGDLGAIVMMPRPVSAGEANVMGERVPLQFRNDTMEYNAKAFKVQPGAVVEDLLKKLPGVEVDRAGNIKALGKDVNNVLVDGKEFFGRDPKVATRNLPADALDKVQVYDKKSDESEFTGIDDGTREQTVNLVLNEESRRGVFGDINGGAGTDNHFKAGAKLYRFTDKSQIAALGSINNISQAGFSMEDYLTFGSGLGSLSGGSGTQIIIGGTGSFPVNFGQSSAGLTTSGVAGLNLSRSKTKDDRIFISYLASGSKRLLDEITKSWNYTPENTFFTGEESEQEQLDISHRINFGLRDRIGTNQNFILNGNIAIANSEASRTSGSSGFIDDAIVNSIIRSSVDLSDRLNGTMNGSYTMKANESRTIIKLSGDASISESLADSRFSNTTTFHSPYSELSASLFQTNKTSSYSASALLNLSQRLGSLWFIEPEIRAGITSEDLTRRHGYPAPGEVIIDSLSPVFLRDYLWLRPGLTVRRNTKKSQLAVGLMAETAGLSTSLNEEPESLRRYTRFLPRIVWEYEYKTGRRIMANYQSRVNTPSAGQLLPVVNNVNPLSLSYGNPDLMPETMHNIYLSWWLFDQFSFTSLMAGLNGTYTLDKISYARDVDEDLVQTMTLINVRDDYRASGNVDFSTPIRPLGMKIGLSLSESFNRGISLVNGQENVSSSLSHRVSLTLENRNKAKWDARIGTRYQLTDAKYSLEGSPDNRYSNISWFSDILYTPNDRWNVAVRGDITNYSSKSFENSELVPLVGAEINLYLFREKRGMLTLNAFDILNGNTGIERISEMNYLRERQTNTIGRFVMLSFKYRLNKLGDNSSSHSGISVISR